MSGVNFLVDKACDYERCGLLSLPQIAELKRWTLLVSGCRVSDYGEGTAAHSGGAGSASMRFEYGASLIEDLTKLEQRLARDDPRSR